MNPSAALSGTLEARLGSTWTVQELHASSFCGTWRARQGAQALFVKTLPLERGDVLEAEADGLAALGAVAAISVPAVIGCWRETELGETVLALEWLDLAHAGAGFAERFGRALASLHRAAPRSGDGRFGWHRDNLLGATPQRNRWSAHTGTEGWIEFVRSERLLAMRSSLAARGAPAALLGAVDDVSAALARFFDDGHVARASLIHGDLWSGNWGMSSDGTPVIYDPAVSYSDHEAELAMMELFGHLPAAFWNAYREVLPIHEGYALRRGVYQLYHLLNHALLFGGGYVHQATELGRALVARL